LRVMLVASVVVLIAASCSTSSSNESVPSTIVPVATLAPTTTADPLVPAADQISVSPVFGGMLDGLRVRGALNIVNSTESYIAASSLKVEHVQNGTVNNLSVFAESGSPPMFLAPGNNWFMFAAFPMLDAFRLRPPVAEYAEPPGSFEVTLDSVSAGGGEVSGSVESRWPVDVTGVSVGVVWFDSSAKPVFGLGTIVLGLEPGQTKSFVIETSVAIDESWTHITFGVERDVSYEEAQSSVDE